MWHGQGINWPEGITSFHARVACDLSRLRGIPWPVLYLRTAKRKVLVQFISTCSHTERTGMENGT